MRKIVKILVMAVLLLSVSSFWKGAGVSASTEPVINVKLVEFLGNKQSVAIKVKGKYQLDSNPELLVEGKDYYIKKDGTKVCFYEGATKQTCQEVFSLKPVTTDSFLYVEGRPYNGTFTFQLDEEGYVRPINSVYLEDYVKGVVPEEMWAKWPTEALKAQATASRSYAARWQSRTLVDGVSNQVYGGYFWSPQFDTSGQYTNAISATDATLGEYLTYKGRLIEGIYSASNGGYTESSTTHWGGEPEDFPYFPAQPDEYDGINEDVQWAVSYHKTQIDTTALDLKNPDSWWSQVKEKDTELVENIKTTLLTDYDKNDVKITAIQGFTFKDLTLGQRYTKADLSLEYFVKDNKDANGNLVLQKQVLKDIPPSKIKALFGSVIKNNYVKSVMEKDGVVTINGAGMGHGVGMSQYGAYNRAVEEHTHSQILSFYYPGTSITKSYTELADRSSLNAELRGWVFAGSDRYYYDPETGATYPGWKKFDDIWYFFEADGKAKTGWVKYAGYWYYMDSEGQMATGWVRDAGKWYYLNADGTMKTGWYKENGVWYYLEPAGDMKIGWKKVGTTWYYFKSSGAMATGWVKSGAKWYYMDQSGAMETGWIEVSGKWYYLYSDGSMAYNTTIGGYKLGSDGAWIR